MDEFYDVTKFYEVPAARPRHVMWGTFVSFVSISNGNVTDLKLEFKERDPFVTLKSDHV